MKKLMTTFSVAFLSILMFGLSVQAQESRPSPATTATGKVGDANITINYSSPSVKGRTVWGELVPYGQVWRAGANEATTFETSKAITVEGKSLPAGKYSLFAIPNKDEWTIIFNKVPNQWGAYKYEQAQDALRVNVKPRKSASANERLNYSVDNKGVVLRWENLEVPVAIK